MSSTRCVIKQIIRPAISSRLIMGVSLLLKDRYLIRCRSYHRVGDNSQQHCSGTIKLTTSLLVLLELQYIC